MSASRFAPILVYRAFKHVTGDAAVLHRLRGTCSRSSGGTTFLRLDVDGHRVLETVDQDGIGGFRSAVAFVGAGVGTGSGCAFRGSAG